MQDQKTIQTYINNFRRHLSPHLKPGIGLSCKAYPVVDEGAVLEFTIGENISNSDQFEQNYESVNAVLKIVPQKMVGGNIDAIWFAGTNMSMEQNRIVIVKGDDDIEQWNDKCAQKDVQNVIRSQSGAKK
jgi:hypothetical protein